MINQSKIKGSTNKTSTSTNKALTFEPILGEFGTCRGAGDIIAYILITKAAQTKLSAAQTSTNEAQTNETIRGEFGAWGGGGGGGGVAE